MVFISRSSLDMQDGAHTMMISDTAIKCRLKGLCLGDIDMNAILKVYGRYRDLIVKYQRLVSDIVRDSFPSDT